MASYAKGGVSEWMETEIDDFLSWFEALRELNGNK
jgi:hypothetical protein